MIKSLTETEVNSAKFDQPLCPIKTKLIICSTPRSGSYLLCRAMIHHRIGVPHEYFNGLNASAIAPRLGLGNIAAPELEIDGPIRQRYIASLMEHRTVNGVFAAKIQGGQFMQYFKRSLDTIPLFHGAYYVHLYREDLLAQAISFHVSLITGRWGLDNTVTTQVSPNPQFFNRAAIENQLQILADQDKEWRLSFARDGIVPLSLTYEAIKDDLRGALRKIVAYAKIELPSYDFSYSEPAPSEFRGPDEPPKSEIRRWFLQVYPKAQGCRG
jgi:LPS sulfotransferase NodH